VTEASNLNFVAVTLNLGDSQEYDAVLNPDGVWHVNGSPDWYNINNIEFYFERTDTNDMIFYVDALYFSKGRYRANVSDVDGEQRDLDIIDDNLKSDDECLCRAQALLYQLKDAPIRIDIETLGNSNILIGDHIPMSIPAENIGVDWTEYYDVISVEHNFGKEEWKTKASMINSSNIRQLPCGTPLESTAKKFNIQHDVAKGLLIIK
jgi:hypothetical protein